MARRVSWTNNSSGHTGTYVYRAPTLDPQALPVPVATVDPVAQGATAEWVDTAAPYECYAVQDFDGQGVGALSTEVCVEEPTPDYASASIGDEIGGGIYAGTITYADARQFHIIAALESGEADGLLWGNNGTVTGATDADDGLANQTEVLTNHDDGSAAAFYHCRDYAGGGNSDWYLPSKNESLLVINNLVKTNHPEFGIGTYLYRQTSTEVNSTAMWMADWQYDQVGQTNKTYSSISTRPIRRVAV